MFDFIELYFIVLYIVACVFNGFIADEKGRNVAGAILRSVIFTPIIGYFFVLALPNLKQQAIEEQRYNGLMEAIKGKNNE